MTDRPEPQPQSSRVELPVTWPLTVSVLTAVYNPVPEHLERCIESVRRQRDDLASERFADDKVAGRQVTVEHIIVDDASTAAGVVELLDELQSVAVDDHGTTVVRRAQNGGIVAASNDALAAASGDWLVLLDHDDELADGAIAELVEHLGRTGTTDPTTPHVVYSDHDIIRTDGQFAEPAYKPDFAPEWLRHTNYITHLVVLRRADVIALDGFRAGTDGAQDHDLLLRLAERGARFDHIPLILLHWRQSPDSVATSIDNKPHAVENGVSVVAAHLARCGVDAAVQPGRFPASYSIVRHAARPPISVVVPTRGSSGRVWGVERTFVVAALRSLCEVGATNPVPTSAPAPLQLVVVADVDTEPTARRRLARLADHLSSAHPTVTIDVVIVDGPFNFSTKINAGVARAHHDHILILNDDTELISGGALTSMAGLLAGGDSIADRYGSVGLVGARLLYPDGTLQHGGHVYHGEFMHAAIGWDGDESGPLRALAVPHEVSGVTAAAMMTTRTIFDEVGGFDEALPLHFNDVAFSLAVRAAGYRVIYDADSAWYHFEGRTRRRGATMEEWRRAARSFTDGVPVDPYYSVNFEPKRSDFVERGGRAGATPYFTTEAGERRFG